MVTLSNNFQIKKAARCLEAGGVIAYPTEGLYGIGCLPQFADAVQRIIEIKGRSAASGLILIAADVELLAGWIAPTAEEFKNLLRTVEHPTTWIVTAPEGIDPLLTGGRQTLAVRITDHPVAAGLSAAVGGPLVSTSANRSGKAPAMSGQQARRKLGHLLDYVISGALGDAAGPSEIRVAATDQVLRPAS